MTGTNLIEQFETLIDDTLDSVASYQLLNNAKNIIENERDWEYLKKWDTLTLSSGYTYTLPSDCNRIIKVVIDDKILTHQVPLADKHSVEGIDNAFYVDYVNKTITFGNTPVATPELFYLRETPDIDDDTEPEIPEKFQSVLTYKMAQIWYSIDAGEKARAWDDRWDIYYNTTLGSMRLWDAKIKQQILNNQNDHNSASGIGTGF